MEFKTNYNKDNVIFVISEIFLKNLVIWECLNEKRKFWKIKYSEYRIIPFYDHFHLENYMLYNSLLKLINFHGFVYTNFRFSLKIIF